MKYSVTGLILIIIGGVMLADNLGLLRVNFTHLLHTWWPAILIAIGISFFFPGGGKRR
ncbi:LiaI-LiaF-like domain-containing protein [Propionivibrio limicola]|uniref:LiaI-LiaF-like domain-containing protein n=1 Tax=Propionivibrio limicola TaxID=167645 RepID=UPI0014781697|nr:DUF5668 domain-containing protein [Propionivibrio limicola]